MPRYTIRDLFLMTTLIAVGLAAIVWATRESRRNDGVLEFQCLVIATGGILIGIGIGTPLKARALAGAIGLLGGFLYIFWLSSEFGHLGPNG